MIRRGSLYYFQAGMCFRYAFQDESRVDERRRIRLAGLYPILDAKGEAGSFFVGGSLARFIGVAVIWYFYGANVGHVALDLVFGSATVYATGLYLVGDVAGLFDDLDCFFVRFVIMLDRLIFSGCIYAVAFFEVFIVGR